MLKLCTPEEVATIASSRGLLAWADEELLQKAFHDTESIIAQALVKPVERPLYRILLDN